MYFHVVWHKMTSILTRVTDVIAGCLGSNLRPW